MAEPVAAAPETRQNSSLPADSSKELSYSIHDMTALFGRQRSILIGVPAAFLAVCLIYCLFGARIYEARARSVALGARHDT